jgi:hypothetical protein
LQAQPDSAPAAPPASPPTTPAGRAAWLVQLVTLFRHHLLLKTAGICLFMAVFFVFYFHLLRHPVFPVTTMPLTALDEAIAFQAWALWPYVSLWVYVGIAPGLMPSLHALLRYGIWAAALCIAGLLCFHFLPTAVPLRPLPPEALAHPGYALLQGVDAAGNACPSLHVATAVFSAFWVGRVLAAAGAPRWLHALSVLWLLAIVWSTMATRQHVALDVAAGAALGAAFAAASLRWGPKWGGDSNATAGLDGGPRYHPAVRGGHAASRMRDRSS